MIYALPSDQYVTRQSVQLNVLMYLLYMIVINFIAKLEKW